jgi:sialidase-1
MKSLLLRSLFAFVGACAGLHGADAPQLHPRGMMLPTSQQGPFVTAADGNVLCVDAQNALRSSDEGTTWSASPLFADPKKYRVSSERALLRTSKGVIIAGWMNMAELKAPKPWNWGAKDANWRDYILPTYVCRSTDDGKTWEAPVKLSDPWCGCIHSLIETKSGRLVLIGQEIIPEWRHATVVFVSDDEGRTWQRSNMLDYGVGRHDHAGSLEGTVIERKDGSLYMLLRTESGYLWESTSVDGLKWEGLKQTAIRSVTCCPQMMRLSDGRIALLWNAPPRHARTNGTSRAELSLAFSSDDARTWSKPVVVAANYAPGARVSYPYLYERKPGEFWITTMQGNLRMKINVTDLSQGEIAVHRPTPTPAPKAGGIIMFGDSTTAPRPGSVKKVYAQRVQESLQGIGSSMVVYNAGIGGNTTRDAKKRLQKDVLQYKPKLVVMQFGINDSAVDVWKEPPATGPRVPIEEYEANLRTMIGEVRQQGAKVVLMTTNPLRWTPLLKDRYGKPPYHVEAEDGFDALHLSKYNDVVRRVAKELNLALVDVRAAYADFAAKHGTTIDELLLDGMHPGDKGHELVTELLVPVVRDQLR